MNDHNDEPHYESMWMRLISMIIVAVLMGFAQTLFWVSGWPKRSAIKLRGLR